MRDFEKVALVAYLAGLVLGAGGMFLLMSLQRASDAIKACQETLQRLRGKP